MPSSQRVLSIIFVVLFFVLVVEVVYIFLNSQKKQAISLIVPTKAVLNTPTPQPQYDSPYSYNCDPTIIQFMDNSIAAGFINSETNTIAYKGTVSKIDNFGGKSPSVGFIYKIKLTIKSKTNTDHDLYFNQDDLDKTTTEQMIGDKKQLMKIEDLTVGDSILVKWSYDILKHTSESTQNTVNVTILKY